MTKFPVTKFKARCFISLWLCCASLGAQAESLQLGELMAVLASNKSGTATFVEKKYLAILDKPIESSGELSFSAPDKLEKHTLKPKAESLVLDGDILTITQAGKRRFSTNIQDRPEVSAFIESIRGTLRGDRKNLEKVYTLELTGSLANWTLVLVPTQAKMREIIQRIRISGIQSDMKSIAFEQADGDRSEMLVSKTSP